MLVVEDDPLIAAFMVKALQVRGYTVTSAPTGADALTNISAGEVDLVLLDLGLADIDGLEVLGRVRRSDPDLPVIVVSARSDPADRARAVGLGVTHYVTKPFPLTELLALVGSVLRGDPPPA